MSWLKKREALQNAGPAVARALTKDKKLDTPKNTANRPPLIGTINIPDVPRGSLKINAWRGDIDQQAFWHKYHKSIDNLCLLYTSPSPRDLSTSRMPSSA